MSRLIWRYGYYGVTAVRRTDDTDTGFNYCRDQFNSHCTVFRPPATHNDQSNRRIFGGRFSKASPAPIPAEWLTKATQLDLAQARTADFPVC